MVTKKKTAVWLFGGPASGVSARASRAAEIPGLLTVRLDSGADSRARFDAVQKNLAQATSSHCCLLSGLEASVEEARALEQRLVALGWALALGIWLREEPLPLDGQPLVVKPDERVLADHFRTQGTLRKVQAVGDPEHIYRAVRKLILAVNEPALPAPWVPLVPSRSSEDTAPRESPDQVAPGMEKPPSADEVGGPPPDERTPSWKRLAAERKARGRRGFAAPRKPARRK